jgi:hypothetical protein
VRDPEGRATFAPRRVFGRIDDEAGLLCGLDHGHHDAGSPHVERARDEMVLGRRHPHERHELGRPGRGHEHTDGVDAPAGVFLVEDHEVRPGGGRDAREARRGKLEDHGSQRHASFFENLLDWIGPHGLSVLCA